MSASILERHAVAEENGEELTPEKLLEMPNGSRYELVDGKLKEHAMGAESSLVATNAVCLLRNHAHGRKLGRCFGSDCGYQAFPHKPGLLRYPDGSFIARGRLPDEKVPKGHIQIAPDLGLEAVSPHDAGEEIEARRIDFMKAGTRLFWVLYPESRTVHVFRHDGTTAVLTENDELRGDDVLPEFACRVSELFEGV
jgi:Uma2 family endonuclease